MPKHCSLPLRNQSATDADVWQLIALARKGQLDLAGAEVAFKQSIDLHPAPAVVTNLGNLYRQMGREQDAMACYNRAIEAAPSHLPARVNKGRSLLALSKLESVVPSIEPYLMWSAQVAKRVGLSLASRGFVRESRSAPSTGCYRRKVHWLFSPLISGTAPRRCKAMLKE